MSVKETEIIDAIGIEDSTNTLVLLIVDPYTWSVQEYDHLKALQAKINNYVRYIEAGGYKKKYGSRSFDGFRIEIEFKYQYSEKAVTVFEAGKRQLKERGINFRYAVVNADNDRK